MATVCIIGAGELGGAVAHALARGGRVRRITLVDDGTTAVGKALDIQQAGAIEGFHAAIAGTGDLTRAAGCAACVIADPAASVRELPQLERLRAALAGAPVVVAGATDAELILHLVRDGRFDRRAVVGSSPEALIAAARSVVALEARCAPSEVSLSVLGTPPSGFVIPWNEVSIGGHSLERLVSHVSIRQLSDRVSRLWPPGPHALGLAAARVVESIVDSGRRRSHVLAALNGEFGVRDRVGVLPVHLAPGGIAQVELPALLPRDRVQLETALGR